MMENDDKLIKNFMLAYKHEIEDNGFSRQVIRRLPQQAQVVIGYTQCNLRHYLLCIILYFQWL